MSDRIILSIDLAHSRYENNGVVVLTDIEECIWVDLYTIPLTGTPDPGRLASFAADLANEVCADLIFLDGPQGWRDPAEDPSELRVCERRLAAPAKTGLPGRVKPANYEPFVSFSIAVFDELHKLGWKRAQHPSDLSSGEQLAVESFPLAAWRSLKIPALPAKAKAKQSDLVDRLGILQTMAPLDVGGDPTHDQLQAIVAGLAGFPDRFDIRAEGVAPREIDGTWREGFIVLPVRRPAAVQPPPPAQPSLFTVSEDRWYGWQMFSGYTAGAYLSPIHVGRFKPLKSGRGLVEIGFFNARYPEGVQDFQIKARVIKRTGDFIVLDLKPNGQPERVAILSELNCDWVTRAVPQISIPESEVDAQDVLNRYYGFNRPAPRRSVPTTYYEVSGTVFRWVKSPEETLLQKWDGEKWIHWPDLFAASGMGGDSMYEQISDERAMMLLKKSAAKAGKKFDAE